MVHKSRKIKKNTIVHLFKNQINNKTCVNNKK